LPDFVIADADLRVEVPGEGELLDGLQCGERLKDAREVFVPAARVPDWSRQIQFPQARQAFELLQFQRAHDRSGQVDTGQMDFARRKLRELGERLPASFQNDLAVPSQDPFGNLTLGSRVRCNCRKAKPKYRPMHQAHSTVCHPPVASTEKGVY